MSKTPLFACRSNGKLLLSGEYFVLSGAKALAIPLQLGQTFEVYATNSNELLWTAYKPNGIWHQVRFNDKLTVVDCSNDSFAHQLQKILIAALNISHKNIADLMHKEIVTHLEFEPDWGLGSSSTLINNLSRYLEIDAYELLAHTFTGSGYDIANAQYSMPLFFLLHNGTPKSVEINFNPPFKEHIYFIYLGKKKNSKSDVNSYKKRKINADDVSQISTISTLMAVCQNASEFQELMQEHETIVARMLEKTPVQQEHFTDFDGSVKSLGAWGGDFVMAVSDKSSDYVTNYFKNKGLDTIFSYNDLILKNPCQEMHNSALKS